METTESTSIIISSAITWADWAILIIIALSVLIGLWRGFVREALSLVTWGAAIVLSLLYCSDMAGYLAEHIQAPALRILAGFGLIFFCVLAVGTILSKIIAAMIKKTGLSGPDRVIGLVFGLLRGILVSAFLIIAVNFIHLDKDPAFERSVLVPKFASMVEWLHHTVPTVTKSTQTA